MTFLAINFTVVMDNLVGIYSIGASSRRSKGKNYQNSHKVVLFVKKSKCITFAQCFIFSTIMSNYYYDHEGWPCIQTHTSQLSLPTPPNTTFFVPPRSVPKLKNYNTNDCGDAIISLNWPSPISNIIPTNQVDSDMNNHDDSRSFVIPRKHNHSTTEICTTTTTTQVLIKFHQSICQKSPSTPTKYLRIA